MDYELKGNLTTILTFILLPILAGIGVDSVTGAAIIGVLATLLCYLLLYFNEKYLSKYFTKEGYVVAKEDELTSNNTVIQDSSEPVEDGA